MPTSCRTEKTRLFTICTLIFCAVVSSPLAVLAQYDICNQSHFDCSQSPLALETIRKTKSRCEAALANGQYDTALLVTRCNTTCDLVFENQCVDITHPELKIFGRGDDIADTVVTIEQDSFLINGQALNPNAEQNKQGILVGIRIPNATMYDEVAPYRFDDFSPGTANNGNALFGEFSPVQNTTRFMRAFSLWRSFGINVVNISAQGGCHCDMNIGLSGDNQNIRNNPGGSDGKKGFQDFRNNIASEEAKAIVRILSLIKKADDIGLIVNFHPFYFGQDHLLHDEQAVIDMLSEFVRLFIEHGFQNVIFETANEFAYNYDHPILNDLSRAHELIELVQELTDKDGIADSQGFIYNPSFTFAHGRLPVSTSFEGGVVPPSNVIDISDYVIAHTNGLSKNAFESFTTSLKSQVGTSKPIYLNEVPGGINGIDLGHVIEDIRFGIGQRVGVAIYWDRVFQSAWPANVTNIWHPNKQTFFNLVTHETT